MERLKQHELLEISFLAWMKNRRFLTRLVFGGGTMLRLCHEMPRYSVDLDFWFYRQTDYPDFFENLSRTLREHYVVTDAANKHFSLLFEIQPKATRRRLKIEIRKEIAPRNSTEEKIAFSSSGNIQVLLRGFTLEHMAQNKIRAFLDRGEIRDAFDLEFLLRKGVRLDLESNAAANLLGRLQKLKKHDFDVKLGSLLPPDLRQYYRTHQFSFLTEKISEYLSHSN